MARGKPGLELKQPDSRAQIPKHHAISTHLLYVYYDEYKDKYLLLRAHNQSKGRVCNVIIISFLYECPVFSTSLIYKTIFSLEI